MCVEWCTYKKTTSSRCIMFIMVEEVESALQELGAGHPKLVTSPVWEQA